MNKDSGEVNVGKAKVYVDGEYHVTADPHINNWQHCNAVIIFNNKTSENDIKVSVYTNHSNALSSITINEDNAYKAKSASVYDGCNFCNRHIFT